MKGTKHPGSTGHYYVQYNHCGDKLLAFFYETKDFEVLTRAEPRYSVKFCLKVSYPNQRFEIEPTSKFVFPNDFLLFMKLCS